VSDHARQLLEHALQLPLAERTHVAAELLFSLEEAEPDIPLDVVGQLWAQEITRRAERAIAGESKGRDAIAVLDSIEAKLLKR
jgi:hypothetical protein